MAVQMNVDNKITSTQCGYNIVDCIQDVIIGMYFLTSDDMFIDRDMFFELCMVVDFTNIANVLKRASQYYPKFFTSDGKMRSQSLKKGIPGKVVASILFPKTFNYDNGEVVVENGILINGVMQKKVLGGKKNSIIHKLSIEYGSALASDFTWKIGLMANHFNCTHGYTFGLMDCMITNREQVDETLKDARKKIKYIMTTNKTKNEKEALIIEALNDVNSIGQKLAKDGMVGGVKNAMSVATMSGAKGNFDNLMSISACLGLQTVVGKRMTPELCEGTRTLPCFKRNDSRLEANCFVSNNYLNGLNPAEMLWISWATRDGLINTAVSTQDSGYSHRKYEKKMENYRTYIDGTIRDCNDKIVDFCYGEHNFDGTMVYYVNNTPFFCDVESVAKICNSLYEQKGGDVSVGFLKLSDKYVDKIVKKFYCKHPALETESSKNVVMRVCHLFRKVMKKVKLYKDAKNIHRFIEKIVNYHNRSVVGNGEMVGGKASNALGEDATQGALNAFHAAGRSTKTMTTGLPRLLEIINLTKDPDITTCSFNYRDPVLKNGTEKEKMFRICELRKFFEYSNLGDLAKLSVEKFPDALTNPYENLLNVHKIHKVPKWAHLYCKLMEVDEPEYTDFAICVKVDHRQMFKYRLSMHEICDEINDFVMEKKRVVVAIPGPPSTETIYVYPIWDACPKKINTTNDSWMYHYVRDTLIPALSLLHITGIPGIKTIFHAEGTRIDVQGNNFSELSCNPCVVFESLDTDVIRDVYENLGIGAAYTFIYRELCKVFTKQILPCNIILLARSMTQDGHLTNVSRHGINDDVGIMTKMMNETVMDIITTGAVWGSNDGTNSAASAYMLGNLGKFGTSTPTFDLISAQ